MSLTLWLRWHVYLTRTTVMEARNQQPVAVEQWPQTVSGDHNWNQMNVGIYQRGDSGGQSWTVRTPRSSLVFSRRYVKALWCVGSLSCCTKIKPEGGACLWRMEWCLSPGRVQSVLCSSPATEEATQPGLEYSHHHASCFKQRSG